MKHLWLLVFALAPLAGCSDERFTTAPDTPPQPTGITFLWGMVVGEAGICIEKASVRLMDGKSPQRLIEQTPCNAWSDAGFDFGPVAAGVPITLRASAPGYADRDITVILTPGPQGPVVIHLSRS